MPSENICTKVFSVRWNWQTLPVDAGCSSIQSAKVPVIKWKKQAVAKNEGSKGKLESQTLGQDSN